MARRGKSATEFPELSLGECVQVLEVTDPQQPVLILGSPGGGKSARIEGLARGLGEGLTTVILAVRQREDVLGIPVDSASLGHGVFAYGPFEWLARISYDEWAGQKPDPKIKHWLFVDEITNAPGQVQTAFLRLVQERRVEGRALHPGVRIVAAGNRAEDNSGSGSVITSLGNRFQVLHLRPTYAEWREGYAIPQKVHLGVISYLAQKPDVFDAFDPDSGGICPTPRAWTNVSRWVYRAQAARVSAGILHAGIAGLVGPGPAVELVAHLALVGQIPTAAEILAAPGTCRVPESPSATHYAIAGLVAALHATPSAGALDGAAAWIQRLIPELRVVAYRDVQALAFSDAPRCTQITPVGVAVGLSKLFQAEFRKLFGDLRRAS